jgi:VIT1/CCC1 family predicted Fe2+/Mn2+ transporter
LPQTPHIERHFTASASVRDIVIGMSDGLTVPFALAAGLSGVVASTGIIVTAGLAEIAAGSIAMGLGGYLAARSDAEHYESERAREQQEVREKAATEATEIAEIFRSYGLTEEESAPVVAALRARPEAWVDF